MSRLYKLIFVIILQGISILTVNAAPDDLQVLVVTNEKSITALNKRQLKQVYLEGGVNFPVKPINLAAGLKARSVFNTKVIGLTESRIKSYWSQMKFTGRITPPKEFATVDDLLGFLSKNPGYIAYVPGTTKLPSSLHVIYRLNY